jgi:hypothetical protein
MFFSRILVRGGTIAPQERGARADLLRDALQLVIEDIAQAGGLLVG